MRAESNRLFHDMNRRLGNTLVENRSQHDVRQELLHAVEGRITSLERKRMLTPETPSSRPTLPKRPKE